MSIIQNNESLETAVVPVKTTSTLTSYAESAPSIEESSRTSDAKLDVISNPYEPQDLKKVLERSYLIGTALFTAAKVSGDLLFQASFPDALFAIENIADKLSQFHYFKADVEVEVRINATQFHIGSMNVSWASHANLGTLPINDPNARLNRNSTIMSLSSINSVKLRIPRSGPLLWDLAHPGPVAGPNIGSLFIDCLDPISTLSGVAATDLQISVFARFINPQVAGYGVTEVAPAMLKRKMRRLALQETKARDAEKKSREEGIQKSEKGLISGIAEAASSFAPLLAMTPFAEFAPIAGLAGQFAPFLQSLGLCKPNDVASVQQVVERPLQDITHMHGLSMAVKLTDHPDASLADTDVSELKRNKISDIISKPCHILASVIDVSTMPDLTFLHFPIHPGLCKWTGTKYFPTYLSYLSQMFGKWRGGLKFTIKFVTSQFTTARIRILHLPNEIVPTSIEAFAGDIPNTVVDIRGNTDFSFTLPYLSACPYLPMGGYCGPQQSSGFAQAFPWPSTWLSVSLVSPVNIPDPSGNSKIYYHVYVSAAEDFVLGEFVGKQPYPTAYIAPPSRLRTKKVQETQSSTNTKKSIDLIFSKPFPGLIPVKAARETALVLPERVHTLEEILKRPRPDYFTTTGLFVSGYLDMSIMIQNSTSAHILNLFMYYRGATRFKVMPSSQYATLMVFDKDASLFRATEVRVGAATAPALEFEIPWNEVTWLRPLNSFDCAQDQILYRLNGVAIPSTAPANLLFSVGEDFMMGMVLPPMPFDPAAPLESEQKIDYSESISNSVTLDQFVL